MPRIRTLPHPDVLPGELVDWRLALAGHYKRLGHRSRQRRFMVDLPNNALQTIADRASPDIVLGVQAEGRLVGVLEIFKGADAHAEIAISVEDAYQGQGFGKALFRDGLVAAEHLNVCTADLYFASENHGIRSMVNAAEGQIVQHGADCEAHITIANCKNHPDIAQDAPFARIVRFLDLQGQDPIA